MEYMNTIANELKDQVLPLKLTNPVLYTSKVILSGGRLPKEKPR
jgi:hypothetical protein